ncbi:MAG: hypothetical protein JRG86_09485 [Deltaproteobacteria bacterium]|jgi:hypothetical protein|nr:hypothetical protein [Deltaproteobacteria bacterium]
MDITTLAAWGEFLGGIAVVASLIYLAGQIRQNSRLLRTSTASASSSVQTDASSLIVQDPEVARIYEAGLADRSSLSEVDRRRFDTLVSMWVGGWNQEFQFSIDGVISPSVWESRTRTMRWYLHQPGMKQFWGEWREMYARDFIDFLDGLIREGEAAG